MKFDRVERREKIRAGGFTESRMTQTISASTSMPAANLASTSRPSSAPESLRVEAVDDSMRGAWDAFITSHPGGSFYHLYDWKRINERELGHQCEYLAARRPDGAIEGVLPLVLVRGKIFGRILCSVPFMNYGGPIASSPAVAALLTQHAAERATALGADYLELRCANALDTQMPVSLRKVSLTVQLNPDPDALFNSFSQKHRKNIRRAQKNDLAVKIGGAELLDDFFSVLELSWRSLGTPLYSKRYFQRIVEVFPDNTTLFICHQQGNPVGVAFVGQANGTVEGMWAGGRPELRHLDANYVLYWEMLRHACAKGFSRFHLGRSTSNSGAEQFKSKWNAEVHQLYWYFHRPDGGAMPELNVDNPKYQLAIRAWQKLPLWATRLMGPHLARLIP